MFHRRGTQDPRAAKAHQHRSERHVGEITLELKGRASSGARPSARSITIGLLWCLVRATTVVENGDDHLEVDDLLSALDDVVNIVTPGAGGEVFPPVVAHDGHDRRARILAKETSALDGPGHNGARR